jgi:hypothetical protein
MIPQWNRPTQGMGLVAWRVKVLRADGNGGGVQAIINP